MSALDIREVSYAAWKSAVQANDWSAFERPDKKTYHVWAGNPAHVLRSFVDREDKADYETLFQPTATPVSSQADALVGIIGEANLGSPPLSRDLAPVVQPVTLEAGQWHHWHGAGDSATTIDAGTAFCLENDGTGTDGLKVVTWNYRDPVWMAGGEMSWWDTKLGDKVSMVIYTPATAVVPNGTNTGNCHIVNSVVIVPAAGDGAYDVDLAASHPVPTPDSARDGFWDYELPADMQGAGTLTASNSPGAAKYHLLAMRKDLVRFIGNKHLNRDGVGLFLPQNIRVSLCLPEWRFECASYVDNTVAHTVELTWEVLVSRWWTTG